jgi:hypothetical protein
MPVDADKQMVILQLHFHLRNCINHALLYTVEEDSEGLEYEPTA